MAETIAAISTGGGPGARAWRAIVRVSGPATGRVLRETCGPATPMVRGVRPVRVRLGEGLDLPALVVATPEPGSYTGEDAAELHVAGRGVLAGRVLDALLARSTANDPVRLAHPGEFTARAFLAGRLTAEQAEGVGALIHASGAAEARAARDVLTGRAGERQASAAADLARLLALVEAGIDFTEEEDVTPIAPSDLAAELARLRDRLAELRGPAHAAADDDARAVVLVGRPNAGKSTLFNALLGRRRSVESATPGSTRDALAEPLDPDRFGASNAGVGGTGVVLIDLPGLDAGAPPGPGSPVRATLDRADAFVWCDPAGAFDPADLPAQFDPGERPVVRVRTKGDLKAGAGPGGAGALGVCALDGWGLNAVGRAIVDAATRTAGGDGSDDRRAAGAVVARHRAALDAAARAVDDALRTFGRADAALGAPELTASALRSGLDELGAVTGRVSPDDVLGRIFATFCVGK